MSDWRGLECTIEGCNYEGSDARLCLRAGLCPTASRDRIVVKPAQDTARLIKEELVHELEPRSGSPALIEGTVETPAETATRMRKEIKAKRKNNGLDIKESQRGGDRAKSDYRLAKVAMVVTVSLTVLVVVGWITAITWGAATNFSGGRGGPLCFYIFALLVGSIGDIIGLGSSVTWTYEHRNTLIQARHQHADCLESSTDYEMDLIEDGNESRYAIPSIPKGSQ